MRRQFSLGLRLHSVFHSILIFQFCTVQAGQKKGEGVALKFEAEATAFLQNSGVPTTDDSPKYIWEDAQTKLVAILTQSGFVNSLDVRILPHSCSVCTAL